MSWDLLCCAPPELDFRLRCSKGTYVRTLAHDLGAKLGCGGHLSALRRTATHSFTVDQALTIDQFEAMARNDIAARLIPVRRPSHRVLRCEVDVFAWRPRTGRVIAGGNCSIGDWHV